MKKAIDPWSVTDNQLKDYDQQIVDWGLSQFDEDLLSKIEKPHYLMRRGILFAHRDFDEYVKAMNNKEPVVMMTGLMPSGKMHLGHKMIVDQMKWYQENGANIVIAISDIEAWVARGITQKESKNTAINESWF